MPKILLAPEEIRQESWRLAAQINAAEAPFDLVVGIIRGGVPIALYLQEFFMLAHPERKIAFAALRCRSYTAIDQAGKVSVGSLADVWEGLGNGSRLLLVDDIFDRGQTIAAAVEAVKKDAPRPLTIKCATLHYKPDNSEVAMRPDYYGRIFAGNEWIVYPEALSDLTGDEDALIRFGFPAEIIAQLRPH